MKKYDNGQLLNEARSQIFFPNMALEQKSLATPDVYQDSVAEPGRQSQLSGIREVSKSIN